MITIKDVAHLANVNISTVSKVFNHYQGISQATKDKVFAAAKDLGYIPSKTATELSKGVQPYLGLILNNLSTNSAKDEYIFRIVSGVQERASELNMDLTLFTASQIKKQEYTYVDFCKRHRLLGTVVHGLPMADPYLAQLLESNLPCVLIDIAHESSTTATISTNNIKAAEDAVALMHQAGRRKVCHILGTPGADVTQARERGYHQAATRLGLTPLVISGEFNEHVAYENTKTLLAAHPDLDGIFASSDLMALGAMRAINEAGRVIGGDISLIGFDGLTTLEYTRPPITTIKQDFHEMGRIAVDTLLAIAGGEDFAGVNYVPYHVMHGGSV